MDDQTPRYTGGCLCGAVRYEAKGETPLMGHCYCADCRKASGSGFIPFMGFSAAAVTFAGEARQFRSRSVRGTDAVRNFCPICGGLVFGCEVGLSDSFTVYAGSLDDAALFEPAIAIMTRDRPVWALIPEGLTIYEGMPG